MKKNYQGDLEVDLETGDVYFSNERGETIFRMKGLPAPISERNFFDVKYLLGSVSWSQPLPDLKGEMESLPYPERLREAIKSERMGM